MRNLTSDDRAPRLNFEKGLRLRLRPPPITPLKSELMRNRLWRRWAIILPSKGESVSDTPTFDCSRGLYSTTTWNSYGFNCFQLDRLEWPPAPGRVKTGPIIEEEKKFRKNCFAIGRGSLAAPDRFRRSFEKELSGFGGHARAS